MSELNLHVTCDTFNIISSEFRIKIMANFLPPSLKNYCKASNLAFNEEVRATLP